MSQIIISDINSLYRFTSGNTILLEDGIYKNINLKLDNNGPIIIKAQNPGKVFFSESIDIVISGKFIILSNIIFTNGRGSIHLKGSNNRITNCEFSLNNGIGPILTIYKYNNRIDHNIFKNFSQVGVWIEIIHENYIPDYIIIDSNIFLDRKKGNGNGFETIRFGNSKTSLRSILN